MADERPAKRAKMTPTVLSEGGVKLIAGAAILEKTAPPTPSATNGQRREGEVSYNIEDAPFRTYQFDNVFDVDHLRAVREQLLSNVTFTPRASDLFSYRGSGDLVDPSIVPPQTPLAQLRDTLYSARFYTFLSVLTDTILSPDAKPDLSSHIYQPGDFLACHDDDIQADKEGRRIAFILYLVDEDWDGNSGGALGLFDIDGRGDPGKVVRSITPRFNRLALFEVTSTSYHEVSEVVGSLNRLSISGWFSGPLRHRLALPSFRRRDARDPEVKLEGAINANYLDTSSHAAHRLFFAENGHLVLPDFLLPPILSSSETLRVGDAEGRYWREAGPASVRRHLIDETTLPPARRLHQLLTSPAFEQLLTSLTACSLSGVSRVHARRFRPGDYSLLHDQGQDPPGLDVILGLQSAPDRHALVEGARGPSSNPKPNGASPGLPEGAGGTIHYVISADASAAGEDEDDDEGDLLVVPPTCNTLHIVLRDEGCLKYVKRVSQAVLGKEATGRLDMEGVYLLAED